MSVNEFVVVRRFHPVVLETVLSLLNIGIYVFIV